MALLATASYDGTARIWNLEMDEQILVLAVATAKSIAWQNDLLAVSAGRHWAVIRLPADL